MEGSSLRPHRRFEVEEVFKDYMGRRAGIIRALTTDFIDFYHQCDPSKENICLFAFSDGSWKVDFPEERVPPEFPEPTLGINFPRDGTPRDEWVKFVAHHSHAWLYAMAHFSSRNGNFDKNDRALLFEKINSHPAVYEIVLECTERQVKRASASQASGKKKACQYGREAPPPPRQDEEEENDDEDDVLCAVCGLNVCPDGFWIFCDFCKKWLHGNCVNIDQAKAKYIKIYKCPYCSRKKNP